MIYRSYNELSGYLLCDSDRLVFKVLKDNKEILLNYRARRRFLANEDSTINEQIFRYLGIKDKYKYVSDICGYLADGGDFPVVRDYESITKVALQLFKDCEATFRKLGEPIVHKEGNILIIY